MKERLCRYQVTRRLLGVGSLPVEFDYAPQQIVEIIDPQIVVAARFEEYTAGIVLRVIQLPGVHHFLIADPNSDTVVYFGVEPILPRGGCQKFTRPANGVVRIRNAGGGVTGRPVEPNLRVMTFRQKFVPV